MVENLSVQVFCLGTLRPQGKTFGVIMPACDKMVSMSLSSSPGVGETRIGTMPFHQP